MDRKNRPVGRHENVSQTGGGNAQRRGDGLHTGPVGDTNHEGSPQTNRPVRQQRAAGNGSGALIGVLISALIGTKGGARWLIIAALVIFGGMYFFGNQPVQEQQTTIQQPVHVQYTAPPIAQNNNQPTSAVVQTTVSFAQSRDNGPYQASTVVASAARPKYTRLKGGGRDIVTVMVYICGADLESQGGMATNNLEQMLKAQIGANVNVVIETGGAKRWQNNVVSADSNQRYQLTSQGMVALDQNVGRKPMTGAATLGDFIKFAKGKFPADRYALVLWDHGGGTITGYGYDELFPGASMTLAKLAEALNEGGTKFDFIGFDACLMATLETAMALEPYADYLIASEETEPGAGWYYTDWITALSVNSSIPTIELAKIIIDDYITVSAQQQASAQVTLSLTDLAELKGTIPSAFKHFASTTAQLIDQNQYKAVATARENTKEFSPQARLNQIDVVNFAQNISTAQAQAFAQALKSCIKYNRTSRTVVNANGLTIYFPSGDNSSMSSLISTYNAIGMDPSYTDCVKDFANLSAGGQMMSSSDGSPLGSLLGEMLGAGAASPSSGADPLTTLLGSFLNGIADNGGQQSTGSEIGSLIGEILGGSQGQSTGGTIGNLLGTFLNNGGMDIIGNLLGQSGISAYDWMDTGRIQRSLEYLELNRFDPNNLVITEKNGQRVIALGEDQWSLVKDIELNVFIDDGQGFIDLGRDNTYSYNDDGDLIMEYDDTWLALNGQIVSYYMLSDDRDGDQYAIVGRVPAMLNGRRVNIILQFDDANENGRVMGAQVVYDAGETETLSKGLTEIVAGDKIDYLCDYYAYDGKYADSYYLGGQYTATGEWAITNAPLKNEKFKATYRFTDIYGNRYWTKAIS